VNVARAKGCIGDIDRDDDVDCVVCSSSSRLSKPTECSTRNAESYCNPGVAVGSEKQPRVSNPIDKKSKCDKSGLHQQVSFDDSHSSFVPLVNKINRFTFCHWNVGGLLPKLNDPDFVQYVSSFDFVCLVETFVTEIKSSFFPSHEAFVKPSIDLGRGGRHSGGVICLIRSSLVKYVRQNTNNANGNFLSFIIDKQLFDCLTDVLFVCAYVPPENSRYYTVYSIDNGINLLEDYLVDCMFSCGEMPILLCGDLNGRTSDSFPEFYDESVLFDCTQKSANEDVARHSEDKVLNTYGKCLLNLCSSFGLCILNGVCNGDLQGRYTFISEFGNSVNDYFILSHDLFHCISSACHLSVAEHIQSQHMPLEFTLSVRTHAEINNTEQNRKETLHKFVWNSDCGQQFTDALKAESCKEKLIQALNLLDTNVDEAIETFNGAIKECASCMSRNVVLQNGPRKFEWYDYECVVSRRHVRQLLRKFRKSSDQVDRNAYCKARREYKNLLYKKKKLFNDNVYNELLSAVHDQKQFWQKMKKLSSKKSQQQNNISVDEWYQHFRNVLDKDENSNDDGDDDDNDDDAYDDEYVEMLDRPISKEEVLIAIRRLKAGKSAGPDYLIAEFFKAAADDIVDFLVKLFNTLFDKGIYPTSWSESIILPLFKKGDVNDTNNYRGISLCAIGSKLYGTIINTRMKEWIELHNLTGECQAGFKQDYSTIDHIFTLLAAVQKQFLKNRKLYVAFIDFEKAFDSISRKLLWPVLIKNGIKGKLYNCVKSMYNDVKAKIRCGAKFTDFVYCTFGVKQGDVCSPILFSLFINELALEIMNNGRHGLTLNPDILELFILLFADDLVLLSETVVGLQTQLNSLYSASVRLHLKVNMNKSNIVVFRKGGHLAARERWFFGGQKMDVVNAYKYLGIYFSTKLSFNFACQDLVSRAKRAVFCILSNLYKFNKMSMPIFIKLFDSQVQPIVQYGAEVWGFMQGSTVEKVHLFAMKRFLGVDRRTPNDLIYGEFGRYPIYLNSYIRCIRYWLKLTRMSESRLPFKAYKMLYILDSKGKNTWATNIRLCLCQYGFQYVWENQGVACIRSFLSCFKQRIIDCRWQDWNSHLQNSERFEMYRTFKTSHFSESYLLLNFDRHIMNALVKFRLGISTIAEHSQRYSKRKEIVYCRLCRSAVEDEVHFVLCCPMLDQLRHELIPAKFFREPCKFKLSLLLSVQSENTLFKLALFLYKSLKYLEVAST